jgi:hypothetical protein
VEQAPEISMLIILVLILATEDNCLGIDFNPNVLASDQVIRPDDLASDGKQAKQAVYRHFEAALRAFGPVECIEIISDPGKLVWIYARALSLAFSCHLELCHRQWNTQVELFANTAEPGNAFDRENIRILVKEYGLHLRYINSTLDNLKRHRKVASNIDSLVDPCIFSLEGLVADFEHFARELEILKKSYESLLQDQVSKIHSKRQGMLAVCGHSRALNSSLSHSVYLRCCLVWLLKSLTLEKLKLLMLIVTAL